MPPVRLIQHPPTRPRLPLIRPKREPSTGPERTRTTLPFNGEKFIYTGEQVDQDYARVDSKVRIPTGKEYSIRYKLHLVANDWKIYDVVVENIFLGS